MPRKTPGVDVERSLERLRHEVNKAQKNLVIDNAIEQLRKDQVLTEEFAQFIKTYAEAGCEDISEELYKKACETLGKPARI